MTPLQLLAIVLAQKHGVAGPATDSAADLRRWVLQTAVSEREREVTQYLIAASDGSLARNGGRLSLKHVLWWLRDEAPDDYAAVGRAVLAHLLEHSEVSLEAVGATLDATGAGEYSELIARRRDPSDLLEHLQLVQVGPWLAATTHSPRNLLSAAMEHTEADLYIAASPRGCVVKSRRIVPFPMPDVVAALNQRMGGWVQPYRDYALRRQTAEMAAILAVIQGTERPKD